MKMERNPWFKWLLLWGDLIIAGNCVMFLWCMYLFLWVYLLVAPSGGYVLTLLIWYNYLPVAAILTCWLDKLENISKNVHIYQDFYLTANIEYEAKSHQATWQQYYLIVNYLSNCRQISFISKVISSTKKRTNSIPYWDNIISWFLTLICRYNLIHIKIWYKYVYWNKPHSISEWLLFHNNLLWLCSCDWYLYEMVLEWNVLFHLPAWLVIYRCKCCEWWLITLISLPFSAHV